MQVCDAAIQASASLSVHSIKGAYSVHSISLNGFGGMTVMVAPVDPDGALKDMRYTLPVYVTFIDTLPESYVELVALDKSYSRKVETTLLSINSFVMCKKMASALSGDQCRVTLPGGTQEEEVDLLLSVLKKEPLPQKAIHALGAYKLADFFEMAEASKVLAAMVPMSTLTERDDALRVMSTGMGHDFLTEQWVAAEAKAVEEIRAKEEQALKDGTQAADYASDTPARAARL